MFSMISVKGSVHIYSCDFCFCKNKARIFSAVPLEHVFKGIYLLLHKDTERDSQTIEPILELKCEYSDEDVETDIGFSVGLCINF